nr:MFS transporter [Oceanobacillus polygoni]
MMSKKKVEIAQDEIAKKRWAIISLASIPLIMTLGNSMLIPILPLMEKKLGITTVQSSYIITLYSIVAIVLIPIAGYLSDRFGRKIVILPSLIIAGIGGLVSGWAAWKMESPYFFIMIGRVLQGIGAAGTAPIVMPLIGDLFKKDEEVSSSLGIIETSNTFGKVLSPILGSLLAVFIWFLPFFAFPVFCLISALLILFLIKKPKKEEEPLTFKQFTQNTKSIFRMHGKWLFAVFIIGIILMFMLFSILFYLSNILEDEHHFTGIKKGFILAIPLASLCISSFIAGKVIKDNMVTMKWITFGGIVLSGVSALAVSFSAQLIYLLAVFLTCGIGIGVSLPCLDALITQTIEKETRGTITSFYSAMRFVGVAAGPPVMALFMKHNVSFMFILLAVFGLIAALLAFKIIRPPKESDKRPV